MCPRGGNTMSRRSPSNTFQVIRSANNRIRPYTPDSDVVPVWLRGFLCSCLLLVAARVKEGIRALHFCFERGACARWSRGNARAQLVPFLLPLLTAVNVGRVMASTHNDVPHT